MGFSHVRRRQGGATGASRGPVPLGVRRGDYRRADGRARADRAAATVADLGSGTGFYTDDVASHVETVYGVDVQAEMHAFYREKGVPENVDLVESDVAVLPFDDGDLDAAFSTMTYHEFASDDAIAELARVIRSDGRLALFDWSAAGDGDHGPPADEVRRERRGRGAGGGGLRRDLRL